MSDSSGIGFVALNDNMYFTCSSGLVPAKIHATQLVHKTSEEYHYLVKDDTACQSIGDFMCRWTVVLAAAIAFAGIVTGGAALAVLAVAAIGASAALCGGLMAPMRKWVGYSTLNAYGRKDAYSLTSKCQMICPIGGVVTYAPGITSLWQALLYTGRNTLWAVAEGFMLGKLATGGFAALTGKASPTMIKALLNFAYLNVTARAAGVVDQVFVEGMLRNGKSFSETGDEAIAGATMFEQPFINIYHRAKSGYYTGGYAKDANGNDIAEAHNGHGTGAAITDTYYALLSAIGMGMMVKASGTHENIAKESIAAAKETIAKAVRGGKRFLFERARGGDPIQQAYQDLAEYRVREGWPEYSLKNGKTGTVAKVNINGKDFYGKSSALSPETLPLRREWLRKIDWTGKKSGIPATLSSAQSLTHAEAHSLINAYEKLGSLPKEVTMYVDRETCNQCVGELPYLLKNMGVEKLNIYSGGETEPITILPKN